MIITTLLFLMLTVGVMGAEPLPMAESCEFKMLLNNELFNEPEKGCASFWRLVEQVAGEHGCQTVSKPEIEDDREICFIDTAAFDLYKSSLLLRVRDEDPIQRQNGLLQFGEDAELTLKYRSNILASATLAPLEAVHGLAEVAGIEEDIAVTASGPRSFFSRSAEFEELVTVPDAPAALVKTFPGLASAGLPASGAFKIVNDLVIVEKRYRQGSINFADKDAKAMFSFWYKKDEPGKLFAAEFSFKLKLNPDKPEKSEKRRRAADAFFIDLISRTQSYRAAHQTKTGMVYGLTD
ncbi:MAG TPA: hypothetical protein PLM07_08075 [Candidatus Rifleibacterium sp.]|nr:hypothetical protein [Candidatus Rifleibacterium sp.]HPT45841.1 hypothetical protein [Candidatus Rifleibacterium sp.]